MQRKKRPSEPEAAASAAGPAGPADARPPDAAAPPAPPPGPEAAQHTAAQRVAHQADVLGGSLFPAIMADALHYGGLDHRACREYLDRLLEESGGARDPVERMMLEQLALAHFRVGQLHLGAANAQHVEAVKAYNAAAARLWGEFRRTALALRAYRGARAPDAATAAKLKIAKTA